MTRIDVERYPANGSDRTIVGFEINAEVPNSQDHATRPRCVRFWMRGIPPPYRPLSLGDSVKKVNLDTVTAEEIQSWQSGDTLLLSGKMLTGRDAAHKKIVDMIEKGEELPVVYIDRVHHGLFG